MPVDGVGLGDSLGDSLGVALSLGVSLGVSLSLALGSAEGVSLGVALGVSLGVALGVSLGVADVSTLGLDVAVIVGLSPGAGLVSAAQAIDPDPATMTRVSRIEAPVRLKRSDAICGSPSGARATTRSGTQPSRTMGLRLWDVLRTKCPSTSRILVDVGRLHQPH